MLEAQDAQVVEGNSCGKVALRVLTAASLNVREICTLELRQVLLVALLQGLVEVIQCRFVVSEATNQLDAQGSYLS